MATTTIASPIQLIHGKDVRLASRNNTYTSPTSGIASGYLQANLIILPSKFARDFRNLCQRNPVPCPLLAESNHIGSYSSVKSCVPGLTKIVSGLDIRRDVPAYMVYKDSKLVKTCCRDIMEEWTDDHVAFLIGCSFSFETALTAAGLTPRHTLMNRNIPMYRTNIPLCPAGRFNTGTYVVSMRSYPKSNIETVRDITRDFSATHGEPIAWGWDALERLGISSIDQPQWGEPPLTKEGKPLGELFGSDEDVPVFWGCGVTPQEAVMAAQIPGTVMAHAPGHMLLLDCRDDDIVGVASKSS